MGRQRRKSIASSPGYGETSDSYGSVRLDSESGLFVLWEGNRERKEKKKKKLCDPLLSLTFIFFLLFSSLFFSFLLFSFLFFSSLLFYFLLFLSLSFFSFFLSFFH